MQSEFIKSLSGFDQMKKSISGIRGICGDDLSLKDVLKFCNNFSFLIKSKKCVIARDTRPSGQMIIETVCAALMKNGIDVFNLGVAPTPVVFREARKYGAGIVVTSSHNPIEWNGLKFIFEGRGINEKELDFVLKDQTFSNNNIGIETKIDSNYVNDALDLVGPIAENPKIVVDIGGGAARDFAPLFLEKIGCKVEIINPDLQNTNRGPDPTADKLSQLILSSMKNDIGFAFDLDGDRLVVVKDGKKQAPDVTMGLGATKALDLGYKRFVLSIDTSIAVEKIIKDRGGAVERSKVGEANVIETMLKNDAQAGGEGSSGGFILPEFNYCRDGILTSGLIATMIGRKDFNQVLSFMESYHQLREKMKIESDLHDKTLEKVIEKITKQYSEIITIDGIKAIIDEDSWVLIRKSNTEDIIRISTESNNLEKCQMIQNKTKELVLSCHEQIK